MENAMAIETTIDKEKAKQHNHWRRQSVGGELMGVGFE